MMFRDFLNSMWLAGSGQIGVLSHLRESQDVEHLRAVDLGRLQQERLYRLLAHSYRNVPYYRAILGEKGWTDGLPLGAISDFFRNLPFLTKELIRLHHSDLRSVDATARGSYVTSSGGSTGEPVSFTQDKAYHMWAMSNKLLFDCWTGYRPGMPRVVLWGSTRDLLVGRETLRTRLDRWVRNETWLNSFRMGEAEMRNYLETIRVSKPVQILAYANSITELSKYAIERGITTYHPKAIMTSAGTLYPSMRQVIEQAFGAPVFDRYGSREVGDMACECESHAGLHVNPLTHIIEVLGPSGEPCGPGEIGEVVVTSLCNYSMPFIRYRIGDMAVQGRDECPCGRTWPVLERVVGRLTDVFVRPDGGTVPPEYFIHLVGVEFRTPAIRKFQFVQEDMNQITLKIVVDGSEFSLSTYQAKIASAVRAAMGHACRLDVECVPDIPPTTSGKHRYTISKVGLGGKPPQRKDEVVTY